MNAIVSARPWHSWCPRRFVELGGKRLASGVWQIPIPSGGYWVAVHHIGEPTYTLKEVK